MSEDLWDGIEFNSIEQTDGLIPYLNEQGKNLSLKTNGKVTGRVLTGHYEKNGFESIKDFRESLIVASQITAMRNYVYDEQDSIEREDVSSLYELNKCLFEIISDNYKYTVFRIMFGPVYPITIFLDEDIAKEGNLSMKLFENSESEGQYSIASFKDMKEFLRVVFNSRKVKYIVSQLMQR